MNPEEIKLPFLSCSSSNDIKKPRGQHHAHCLPPQLGSHYSESDGENRKGRSRINNQNLKLPVFRYFGRTESITDLNSGVSLHKSGRSRMA